MNVMVSGTTLMETWRQMRAICARCKVPLESVATHGGWSPHLCHDRMHSKAFDLFLDRVRCVSPNNDDPEIVVLSLRYFFLRMPPWERPIALKILEHANVYQPPAEW